MKVDAAGLPSQTRFRVRGRSADGLCWLELEPLTGRTHQLRVHCAAMGFPILGDPVYGTAPRAGGPPLHLHARSIIVPFKPGAEPVAVTAPVPDAHARGFGGVRGGGFYLERCTPSSSRLERSGTPGPPAEERPSACDPGSRGNAAWPG